MQGQFQRNQQKAIDVLLSKCCEVSLEVPSARVRSTQKIYGEQMPLNHGVIEGAFLGIWDGSSVYSGLGLQRIG